MRTTSPLGRPPDFSYRSNVLVVALSALIAIAYGIAEFLLGLSPASPWWAAGGASFLAWAIARELDPEHPSSATVAVGVMALLAAVVQPPLLYAFGALTGLRLTAGTVGLPMKTSDCLAAVAIGGVLGLSDASLAAALMLAFGIIVIGAASLTAIAVAVASLVAALAVTLVAGFEGQWSGPDGLGVSLAVASTVSLLLTVPARLSSVKTDVGDGEVSASRVTLARWLAWGGVVLTFAIYGGDGLLATAPLVAGSAGVALLRIGRPLLGARADTEVGSSS